MQNHYGNNVNREQNNFENERIMNQNIERDNNLVNDSERRHSDQDKVLVGIFEEENEAINVIRHLKETGYHEDEITVLAKNKEQMKHIDETTDVDTKSQSSGGKVGTGATIGAVLGGVAAALPALGLLIIPGIGPLLAAGPIAVILGGVVTGGVAGGLVGVFVQLGVREEDAKEYENYIEQGKILILVENKEDLRENVQNTFMDNNSINTDRGLQQ